MVGLLLPFDSDGNPFQESGYPYRNYKVVRNSQLVHLNTLPYAQQNNGLN